MNRPVLCSVIAALAGCSSSPSHPGDARGSGDATATDAASQDAPVDGTSGAHLWVLRYYVGYGINDYPIADIDCA